MRVEVGPELLGRDLYEQLLAYGKDPHPFWSKSGFPVPINRRIAFGAAAACWGGEPQIVQCRGRSQVGIS